jgi:hypothetical protein
MMDVAGPTMNRVLPMSTSKQSSRERKIEHVALTDEQAANLAI